MLWQVQVSLQITQMKIRCNVDDTTIAVNGSNQVNLKDSGVSLGKR